MNVAVVLTGHFRCWKEVFPNFKERIIDKLNPDIFIHTWSDEAYWIPGDKQSSTGVYDNAPKVDITEVISHYKPIECVMENWEDYNEKFDERGKEFVNFAHRPKNILSMFYKMHQGVSLLESHIAKTGKQYDLVIRMRPDMLFHENLPAFEPNVFYTLPHRNHLGQGTGDMMQVGNFSQILLFSKAICFMRQLYSQTQLLCPHIISVQNIKNLNFSWKEFMIHKTLMHTPKGEYVEPDKEKGYA